MNPTIRQSVIDAAYRKDPEDASAEWGAVFRGDLSGWADRALIEAAVDHGMIVRPPIPGVPYVGFTDPSGGAKDSFTAAVAHAEGDTAVLDCLVEVKAPFNPDEAAAQIADVLKATASPRSPRTATRHDGRLPPSVVTALSLSIPSESDPRFTSMPCRCSRQDARGFSTTSDSSRSSPAWCAPPRRAAAIRSTMAKPALTTCAIVLPAR
jgi:hypothetical protein